MWLIYTWRQGEKKKEKQDGMVDFTDLDKIKYTTQT